MSLSCSSTDRIVGQYEKNNNSLIFREQIDQSVLADLYQSSVYMATYPVSLKKYRFLPQSENANIPKNILSALLKSHYTPFVKYDRIEWKNSQDNLIPGKTLPFALIRNYYELATTPEQKRACFFYLLHYQHYNAEYTDRECEQLGYAPPLSAIQSMPGYIRTEYKRLLVLAKQWISLHLAPFLRSSFLDCTKPHYAIRMTSNSAIESLSTLYSNEIEIIDLQSLCDQVKNKQQPSKNQFIVIELSAEDLHTHILYTLEDRLKEIPRAPTLGGIRTARQNIKFIFELKIPDINVSMIWVATWKSPKKNNTLYCLHLSHKNAFGSPCYSLLNKSGAVPDRIDTFNFILQNLSGGNFQSELQRIGLVCEQGFDFALPQFSWKDILKNISTFSFKRDKALTRYREAIIIWHESFFEKFALTEFAAPLLCSQVAPWMTQRSTIVEWTKAYQNICEIVMFCLKSYPERFADISYESQVLNIVNQMVDLTGIHATATIFPYAMTATFNVLNNIITDDTVSVGCVCQNYFETVMLCEELAKSGTIQIQNKDSLEDIEGLPNVIIVDIHPNNAARKRLFQNDLANWVKEKLTDDPDAKTKLIMDITLNNLSDPILKDTFLTFKPFIQEGRLEVYCIQSLAKLYQLGADNYSGGACFYLGNCDAVENHPHFPASTPEKSAFFGLLVRNFSDLITGYIGQIRKHTEWMYCKLKDRFSDMEKLHQVTKSGICKQFFAATVKTNADEDTIYVGISFHPILDLLEIEKSDMRGKIVQRFQELLLDLAKMKRLPITGRQSIGFSISNFSCVCDSIRFSIGVENHHLLKRHVDLISSFCQALTHELTLHSTDHLTETHFINEMLPQFIDKIKLVYSAMSNKDALPQIDIPLYDESESFNCEVPESCGKANILFNNGQLNLHVMSTDTSDQNPIVVPQSQIAIDRDMFSNHEWTPIHLVHLLYQLCSEKNELSIMTSESYPNMYFIRGLYEEPNLFTDVSGIVDQSSGITFLFQPSFSLTLPSGRLIHDDQIYVSLKEYRSKPVRMSKLGHHECYEIYQRCVMSELRVTPYRRMNSFLLEFGEDKPIMDYSQSIVNHYRKGGFKKVEDFLSQLDLQNLALSHNQRWSSFHKCYGQTWSVLWELNELIIEQYKIDLLTKFFDIENQDCLIEVMRGLIRTLFMDDANVPKKLVRKFMKLKAR